MSVTIFVLAIGSWCFVALVVGIAAGKWIRGPR